MIATAIHIRWMLSRDLPEVLAIEEASWAEPWQADDLKAYLRQRNCIGMVAEHGETIAGYMVYELHAQRIQLINLTVHPEYRRQGVGRQMVHRLISKLSSHRRTRLVVEVHEANLPSQLWLRALGFRAVNVLRDYYGPGEAGYVFRYRLGE